MQFDYEYAHQIMLAMAASPYPDPINDPDFLPQFVKTSLGTHANCEQNAKFYYHVEQLKQAEYITAQQDGPTWTPITLTYAGHQHLAAINLPGAKDRIKAIADKTPGITLDIVFAVAKAGINEAIRALGEIYNMDDLTAMPDIDSDTVDLIYTTRLPASK